ncbi:MAG TPA: hypothetical protein VNR64_08885 [Vicinamibacterales bacterium]|nr:hypothetical protein [Vicinamibacterales bacterium]
MRKTGVLLFVVLAMAVPASGQTKLSATSHCAKANPEYSIDVGDKPGHMLTARKAECTWDGLQIAGMNVKSGQDVSTGEITGATMRDNGYHTATADNGDKFTVHFTGTSTMAKDNTGTFTGKWTFVSGTGKLKSIKGGGTFKGKANADGTADFSIEGDYSLVPAAGKK